VLTGPEFVRIVTRNAAANARAKNPIRIDVPDLTTFARLVTSEGAVVVDQSIKIYQ